MASSGSKQEILEESDELVEPDLEEEEEELEDGLAADLDESAGPDSIEDIEDEDEFDDDEDLAPRAKAVKADSEEDEDLEPEDLEADLDAILRDRMAASDDDEDETEGTASLPKGPAPEDIITCPSCFLGVNRSQLDNQEFCPHCGDLLPDA